MSLVTLQFKIFLKYFIRNIHGYPLQGSVPLLSVFGPKNNSSRETISDKDRISTVPKATVSWHLWDILELFANLAKKHEVVDEEIVYSDERFKKCYIDMVWQLTLPKRVGSLKISWPNLKKHSPKALQNLIFHFLHFRPYLCGKSFKLPWVEKS